MTTPMLDVGNVSRAFDMLRAVDDVSLSVAEGETVGIIGTNGSGKTTLLNLITGYLQPTSGRILFRGSDITGLGPRRVTTLGVARSFQVPQLYTGLTVIENVMLFPPSVQVMASLLVPLGTAVTELGFGGMRP